MMNHLKQYLLPSGLVALLGGLVALVAAVPARADVLRDFTGYTRPGTPSGKVVKEKDGKLRFVVDEGAIKSPHLGGTVHYMVLDLRAYAADEVWSEVVRDLLKGFKPGEDGSGRASPDYDRDARYLYLYQVVNDLPATETGLRSSSVFLHDPGVITSWGHFVGYGFSFTELEKEKHVTRPVSSTFVLDADRWLYRNPDREHRSALLQGIEKYASIDKSGIRVGTGEDPVRSPDRVILVAGVTAYQQGSLGLHTGTVVHAQPVIQAVPVYHVQPVVGHVCGVPSYSVCGRSMGYAGSGWYSGYGVQPGAAWYSGYGVQPSAGWYGGYGILSTGGWHSGYGFQPGATWYSGPSYYPGYGWPAGYGATLTGGWYTGHGLHTGAYVYGAGQVVPGSYVTGVSTLSSESLATGTGVIIPGTLGMSTGIGGAYTVSGFAGGAVRGAVVDRASRSFLRASWLNGNVLRPRERSALYGFTSHLPPTYDEVQLRGIQLAGIKPAVGEAGVAVALGIAPVGRVPTPVAPAAEVSVMPAVGGGGGSLGSLGGVMAGGGGTGGGGFATPGLISMGGGTSGGGALGGGLGGGSGGGAATGQQQQQQQPGQPSGSVQVNNNVNVQQSQTQSNTQSQTQTNTQTQKQTPARTPKQPSKPPHDHKPPPGEEIPEPAAFLTALLGLPALWFWRRRKHAKAEVPA